MEKGFSTYDLRSLQWAVVRRAAATAQRATATAQRAVATAQHSPPTAERIGGSGRTNFRRGRWMYEILVVWGGVGG
jgi:hypothetical protein